MYIANTAIFNTIAAPTTVRAIPIFLNFFAFTSSFFFAECDTIKRTIPIISEITERNIIIRAKKKINKTNIICFLLKIPFCLLPNSLFYICSSPISLSIVLLFAFVRDLKVIFLFQCLKKSISKNQ